MNTTLRPYTPQDFETLYQIDQACYPPGIAYSPRMLRWFLRLPGAVCIVAEACEQHAIAGFILAECATWPPRHMGSNHEILRHQNSAAQHDRTSPEWEQHREADAHMITLDVLPQFRRCGIGTALLEAIEQRLAARGAQLIELETATDNQAAVAFWTKCGYRTVSLLPKYYLDRIDAFLMTKTL